MKNKQKGWGYLNMSFLLLGLFFVTSCHQPAVDYPKVIDPNDNPTTPSKVELGKQLFFDTRLSIDNTVSCATCHQPDRAFTDNLPFSNGVHGHKSMRNAPTLINVAYQPHFMFEAEIKTLEMQVVVPITDINEMGFEKISELVDKLRKIPEYQAMAQEAFGRPFDVWVLTRALAAFQRTLIAWDSDFDRYYFEGKPLSASAARGYRILSEQLYCTQCHPAPFFTTFELSSNGLGDTLDGGRYRITGNQTDFGLFKIPTLKSITETHPYMHNGSIENLEEVIDYYAKGGNGGINQSPLIVPFSLSSEEKKDLIAFFESLKVSGEIKF